MTVFGVVWLCCTFFFFKQKTAYEMRISDWSSDVCSSDLSFRGQVSALSSLVLTKNGQSTKPVLGWLSRATCRTNCTNRCCGLSNPPDRKSVVSGKSVSVRVDLGGRRIIKNKTTKQTPPTNY